MEVRGRNTGRHKRKGMKQRQREEGGRQTKKKWPEKTYFSRIKEEEGGGADHNIGRIARDGGTIKACTM